MICYVCYLFGSLSAVGGKLGSWGLAIMSGVPESDAGGSPEPPAKARPGKRKRAPFTQPKWGGASCAKATAKASGVSSSAPESQSGEPEPDDEEGWARWWQTKFDAREAALAAAAAPGADRSNPLEDAVLEEQRPPIDWNSVEQLQRLNRLIDRAREEYNPDTFYDSDYDN